MKLIWGSPLRGFSFCDIQFWAFLWMAQEVGRILKLPGLSQCRGQLLVLACWSSLDVLVSSSREFLSCHCTWASEMWGGGLQQERPCFPSHEPVKKPIKVPRQFSQTQALERWRDNYVKLHRREDPGINVPGHTSPWAHTVSELQGFCDKTFSSSTWWSVHEGTWHLSKYTVSG